MIYCMADIHGEYDLFLEMLKKINFSENDTMYILGDMIDKGPSSIKLLQYVFSHKNIICLMGNHEYDFLKHYHSLMESCDDNTNYDEILNKLKTFFPDGKLLTFDIIDKLDDLPYFIETEKFILVHSGVEVINGKMKPLLNTSIEHLVYNRTFKDCNVPVSNKCIIYGHTPVRYISNRDEILCYSRDEQINNYYKIHLDTGVYLSGILGCICLDNFKTYYVKKSLI